MKTEKKLQRQCVLCGKTINYVLVEDDGYDWEGHHRSSGSSYTVNDSCNCTQYKRMCLNCRWYTGTACSNQTTVENYVKKLNNDVFDIDVKILGIKKPTKCCDNWELSKNIANNLFKPTLEI